MERQIRFRYEEIADHMTCAIEDGTIPHGEKLPSLRKMSRRYDCSISVVTQAYELLEQSGLCYSLEKSGFYASLAKSGPIPQPQKEKHYLKSEKVSPLSIIGRIVEASNDSSVIPLGAGLPHESLLPVKSLKQNISRLLKDDFNLLGEYADEAGNPSLRREIVKLLIQRGIPVSPEQVLITNGCTEALSLAIQSCSQPGDAIVTESPVFLGIIQILNQLNRRIIPVPTSADKGVDLVQLESVLAKGEVKAVIMSAIHQNPLGFVMDETNRKEAVRLAEKYGVTLIEDDIYNRCSFTHKEERPLKSYDKTGNVIYCSSFSKTISPGVRIGWLSGGKNHEACRRLKMSLTLGGDPLIQAAIAEYLKSPRYEASTRKLQKAICRQSGELRALILKYFPEGSAVSLPKGGFYLWVEVPGDLDTRELFELALRKGISIVPGSAFGTGERFRNCLRLSTASPVSDEIRNAVKELGKLIQDLMK